MKQSARAVRACATPNRGTSAPGGVANPLSLHVRCFDLVTRPGPNARSQILHSPPAVNFSSPKTAKPRWAVPTGVS
jgi:hypothetical protein